MNANDKTTPDTPDTADARPPYLIYVPIVFVILFVVDLFFTDFRSTQGISNLLLMVGLFISSLGNNLPKQDKRKRPLEWLSLAVIVPVALLIFYSAYAASHWAR